MKELVEEIFDFLYKGQYAANLFSHPQNYQENPILNNLVLNSNISTKPKDKKTCDEVFYEYLYNFKEKTNRKYLSLLIKFVLLFRECFDLHKNKEIKEEEKKAVTGTITPESLPDLCN